MWRSLACEHGSVITVNDDEIKTFHSVEDAIKSIESDSYLTSAKKENLKEF